MSSGKPFYEKTVGVGSITEGMTMTERTIRLKPYVDYRGAERYDDVMWEERWANARRHLDAVKSRATATVLEGTGKGCLSPGAAKAEPWS